MIWCLLFFNVEQVVDLLHLWCFYVLGTTIFGATRKVREDLDISENAWSIACWYGYEIQFKTRNWRYNWGKNIYFFTSSSISFTVLCSHTMHILILGLNLTQLWQNPDGIYQLKVNNRSTGTRCEICLKWTIKILERRHRRRSGVCIVNFKNISDLVLCFYW